MNIVNSVLSPISISFIVIIVGYFLGQIKLFKISLDLAGVLVTAVLAGLLLEVVFSRHMIVDMSEYQVNMKFFSNIGTTLFISSIGVAAGGVFDFFDQKNMKSVLIGALMVSSAFITMKVISILDKGISSSKLIGSLCGALTTTPGLSAACELDNLVSGEIVLGYGSSYLFGVVATVLFVQLTIKNGKIKFKTRKTSKKQNSKPALCGLIQISIAIVLGRLIGSVNILNFSLGNSGGILCSGIFIGMIVKKHFQNKLLTTQELTPFRNLGLVLFFVGNGIPAGMNIYSGFDFKVILYGILFTMVPIMSGVILHKVIFKEGKTAVTIAGGMTSTPAIGVLVEKNKTIDISRYAFAYFGALITIIVLIRLCNV